MWLILGLCWCWYWFIVSVAYTGPILVLVLIKYTIRRKIPVVVATVHRPPSSDLEYATLSMDNLGELVQQNKSAILFTGGDFNLPDINWNDMYVTGNKYPVPANEPYLNTSLDLGLEQLVDFPTRFNPDNTLDLLFTNRPSLVQKCSVPGLSEHAAVLISTRLRPAKSKPAKRKILLWKRVDMASVRGRIDELTQEFHEAHTTETHIQDLWDAFSSSMKQLMKDHIPSKWTSSTCTKPWRTPW